LRASAIGLYAAAFLAGCDAPPGRPVIDGASVYGLVPEAGDPRLRLLVTDDDGHELLAATLPEVRTGNVRVFATATRCVDLLRSQSGWSSDTVTAMACRDLRAVPELSLPGELRVRPVVRHDGEHGRGVALEDAVAAAKSAAPSIAEPADALAEYLRALPPGYRLFAAIDGEGRVRATAGSGVFGHHALVIFVNTDPAWRRRGVGHAMTAHALRAAKLQGASEACVDASAAGRSIYRRLGFEPAGTLRRFRRTD